MTEPSLIDRSQDTYSFLKGGGETGALIAAKDWSKTSLGPISLWPVSLRTTLGIILHSGFPKILYWGEDLICFYNDAFRPSLGIDGRHPAIGKTGQEVWPEIWDFIGPLIRQVMKTGKFVKYDDQLVPFYRDGKIEDIYFTFSFSPAFDDNGAISGVFVTCTETTEKILNTKSLMESRDQLGFAIEATQLGTWDVNPFTNKLSANNRLKDWFGLSPEEEVDLDLAINVIAEKDRNKVVEAIQRSLQYSSEGHYNIEYSIIHPITRKERIVRAMGRTWFNEDKIAYRFNGTLQDVTEQAIARRKVEESEKNLRNTILQAPVAMCIFKGQDHVVEIANERMLEFWGTDQQAIGKPIFEALPHVRGEGFEELLHMVYHTGETYRAYGVPVPLMRNNELNTVYVAFVYEAFREADGTISGVMAVAQEVTEQVIANKKIEESAQQVKALVESAPFPIGVYTGREMRIQFANQTILDIWGKGNDVIGKLYSEVLPELENQQIFEQLDGVYTTGIPFHAKNQRVDLMVDGILQPYYFNYSFTPLYDTEGKVYGVMNTAADVTDLNIAKQKLEESELFAKSIIQRSSAAQIIWEGEEMICRMVNEKMLELMGRDHSIVGMTFKEAIPELVHTKLGKKLTQVMRTGQTYYQPEEKIEVIRHGTPYIGYYSYTFQVLKDASGNDHGILCTAIEVTDLINARKKLEEEKERTKLAMEAGEMGIFEIDLKTSTIIPDRRFNEIFGFKANMNWEAYAAVFHPDDLNLLRMPVEQLQKGIFDRETKIMHHDGATRWIRNKGKLYLDAEGAPSRIIGVVQDITERKEAEEALELQNAKLQRINNDLDNFIYTASHDLKAPMSNIEGLLNTLKDTIDMEYGKLGSETEMLFQFMERSINRFKTTILDLTEITKAQKAEEEDINELNFSQIVEDVKLSIYDKVAESKATILHDLSMANTIKFSKKNLRSIIYNLLSNAIKYRDHDRPCEIFIRTEKTDDHTVLTVSDNGLGMRPESKKKLFTMFKRFHDHVEGTGIGLYIVKRIMENAGGKIEVESEEGVGTTFKLYFKG